MWRWKASRAALKPVLGEDAATAQREAALRELGSINDLPLDRHHAWAGERWDGGGHPGGSGLAGVTAGTGQPVDHRGSQIHATRSGRDSPATSRR